MTRNTKDQTLRGRLRQIFLFSWRDCAVCVGILAAAGLLCALLRMIDSSDVYVALIFECAVVLVSRFTDGYLFGLLASVIGVVGVNWIFTYPYMQLNFTISGYPLTFLVMLAVSVVVGTLTTQIKQQEKLRAEAEREKMRGNLLRAVSHDIRTPLTAIVGGIDAILENGSQISPETSRDLLENMRDESNWLIGVVENLLSVTRMSGASNIKKELEAGEEVLGAASMKFKRHYPAVEVSITAPDTLLMIPMDIILIEQVLINLMENAVQHGKTTTRIELRLSSADGLAVFEVADNGCGIEKELLPHLFEGYLTRDQEEISDQRRNMGIGLSVCMSRRTAVRCVRKTGKKAALCCNFHCHWRKTAMNIRDKVLLVEDERTIRSFMQAILTANGYDVLMAGTGAMADTMIASHCPDIIILDLGLPDMDGMTILRNVRKWSKVPILVVSARSHERDKVEALDAGADDYLTKPFGTEELLARIRVAVRHTRTPEGAAAVANSGVFTAGELTIDYDKHRVYIAGRDANLTQNEYKLVALLGLHAGKVLTYDYLIKELWGPSARSDNQILRVNMANIRRKIEKNPAQPAYIFTESGVGYRMVEGD